MTSLSNRLSGFVGIPFWLSVQSGEKRGLHYSILRRVLSFAADCYAFCLSGYFFAEKIGLRRRASLPKPVVSIGNITSGGTGKTPFTQLIAETLRSEGLQPAILSRGHGGRLSSSIAQVSDASGRILLDAADTGDEAAALALLTPGVPVFIGKDRVASGRLALKRCRAGVFLLDDGLQFWQLKRDLDIVLIDSREPFDNGYALPRGRLREPKRNLQRAGIIVITRSDLAGDSQLQALEQEIAQLAPAAAVFRAIHRVTGLTPLNDLAERINPVLRPVAACGIAQPAAFSASLHASGIPVSGERFVVLDDHSKYTPEILSKIAETIAETGADSLIVTQKDAVKFDASQFDVPVYAAELAVQVDNAAEFWHQLRRRAGLAQHQQPAHAAP